MVGLGAQVLVGLAVLFFGRRLFWLFVGAAGFLFGITIAPQLIGDQPAWLALLIAVVIGLAAALAAVFLQRLMVALAGFVVGGTIAITLLPLLGVPLAERTTIVAFILAGIVGAVLVAVTFDWALILLSSLSGAYLLATAGQTWLALPGTVALAVFLVLLIVGFGFQSRALSGERSAQRLSV